MKTVLYYFIFFFWFIASLLPLRFLYIFSDLLYFPLYYCVRYRRKIVRKNLIESFPEKTGNQRSGAAPAYHSSTGKRTKCTGSAGGN